MWSRVAGGTVVEQGCWWKKLVVVLSLSLSGLEDGHNNASHTVL
jgi:hypothetical protein